MIKKSKLFRKKNDEGYALISVLMIGFLILSLFLGLFLVRYFNNILSERRVQKKKLELACYSAVQKHLCSLNDLQREGMYSPDVDSINVTVQYRMKGLFYEITARAKGRRDSSCVRYLFAPEVNKLFGNALVISRLDLDAAYAGDNRIEGDILASSNKIRKEEIFGIKTPKMNYLEGKFQVNRSLKEKLFPESMVSKLFEYKGENERKTLKGDFRLDFSQLDSLKSLYITGNLSLRGASFKKNTIVTIQEFT